MLMTADTVQTLNNLIQICRDGESGFRHAAESLNDNGLKNELMQYSYNRRDFAQRLQELVLTADEEVTERGSVAGAIHRGWMNIREAVSSHDRYAILAECERGEDAALKAYRSAAEEPLPEPCSSLIQLQLVEVQATHDRIKTLRDLAKPV